MNPQNNMEMSETMPEASDIVVAKNRRQVYISITDKGLEHLEVMIGELLHEVMRALSGFTKAEKKKIEKSAVTMSELFQKDARLYQEKRDEKNG